MCGVPMSETITPRLLSREQAAYYVGMSVGLFRDIVEPFVRPISLDRRRRLWDRVALDRWIDSKSDIAMREQSENANPLDALQ
ncbi:hypothetical protein AAJCM20276_27600 [Acetobacter aceti]|uniref:Uncharacterized protein n=1 Tax=Acetobacter aceti TaxID=435 RepID=A0A6S6PMZ9_ACEAC|nr:hypothetical protein AAJCM20276_27600 [Acetobacter aceti]